MIKSALRLCPPVLPWATCNNWWNLDTCVSPYHRDDLDCWPQTYNATLNITVCQLNDTVVPETSLTDPVREFWE